MTFVNDILETKHNETISSSNNCHSVSVTEHSCKLKLGCYATTWATKNNSISWM